MGAFDQFKDKADDVAEQAKGAMNGKRNKPADAERPERAERRMPQEGDSSEFEDQAQRRMGRENEEQDDWA